MNENAEKIEQDEFPKWILWTGWTVLMLGVIGVGVEGRNPEHGVMMVLLRLASIQIPWILGMFVFVFTAMGWNRFSTARACWNVLVMLFWLSTAIGIYIAWR